MKFEVALFKDIFDTLERLGQHIVAVARLPKKRRGELLAVLSETYQLLDRVLLMVIGRIGRVVDRAERGERENFVSELSKLEWDQEWLHSEREMSISSGLRKMHAEMERAPSQLLSRAAVKDWEALKEIMSTAMVNEGGLAQEIALMLGNVARLSDDARISDEGFSHALTELNSARESLENERKRLIKAEVQIYSVL